MRNTVFRIRRAMGISTTELAKRLGVSPRSVERWEAREYNPSPLAQQKLREVVHARRLEVEQERASRASSSSNSSPDTTNGEAKVSPDGEPAENGPVRRGFLPSIP